MRTSADVTVDRPAEAVWALVTDVDGVIATLPGATLSRDGDAVSGSLKCKLGTSQVTYRITVRAAVGQPEFHSAVLTVTGKESRGSGTIEATVTVALRAEPPATRIEAAGDVQATGRGATAGEAEWAAVIRSLLASIAPAAVSSSTSATASIAEPVTPEPVTPEPVTPEPVTPEPAVPQPPAAAAAGSGSRPPLTVAPSLPTPQTASLMGSDLARQLGVGVAVFGLLLLLRAIRRHRRG
jgi:carbon monoxide dehydrogenase subunit G